MGRVVVQMSHGMNTFQETQQLAKFESFARILGQPLALNDFDE